jgi:hypothetical protein
MSKREDQERYFVPTIFRGSKQRDIVIANRPNDKGRVSRAAWWRCWMLAPLDHTRARPRNLTAGTLRSDAR